LKTFQIRIDTTVARTSFGLNGGFALGAAVIFFPLLHLLGFFSIAFGDRRFSRSSDGSLLRAAVRVN
jgi:hypothetical protein